MIAELFQKKKNFRIPIRNFYLQIMKNFIISPFIILSNCLKTFPIIFNYYMYGIC